MKQRRLGKSGLIVSEIGLGCWQLGGDFGPLEHARSQQILDAAEQCDINFWDTADVYGAGRSERRIGEYLERNGNVAIVASKVGRDGSLYPDGYTKEKVRASLEASIERLGVDTLDLAQLHCVPPAVLKDGDLLCWMEDFQTAGLIRAFGASVETLDEAIFAVTFPALSSLQIIFNIFRQNAITDLFPLAEANNVGIIVRLPLASGLLAGGMSRGQTFAETDHRHYNRNGEIFSQGETFSGIPLDAGVGLVDAIRDDVPEGMSMAQMALRWILDHAAVSTVIAGASRPEQVRQNARASELATLPAALHRQLAEHYRLNVAPGIRVPV